MKKKKAESEFLTVEDGESVKIKSLREIKLVTKTGFGGEEKEVVRLVVDVDTDEGVRTKKFDNGTQRFAQELEAKGVDVGCSFTLSRAGQQTKTRYTVSDVAKAGGAVAPATAPAPASAVAPASAPATPAATPPTPASAG